MEKRRYKTGHGFTHLFQVLSRGGYLNEPLFNATAESESGVHSPGIAFSSPTPVIFLRSFVIRIKRRKASLLASCFRHSSRSVRRREDGWLPPSLPPPARQTFLRAVVYIGEERGSPSEIIRGTRWIEGNKKKLRRRRRRRSSSIFAFDREFFSFSFDRWSWWVPCVFERVSRVSSRSYHKYGNYWHHSVELN